MRRVFWTSNVLGILVAATAAMAPTAGSALNLLSNGSFESGDFTGWSANDPSNSTLVYVGPFGTISGAEDGNYYVASGSVGVDATLSQTFSDSVGQKYEVTGWVASDGGSPSHYSVGIDSNTFASANPASQIGWTEVSTTFIGTGSDTLNIVSNNDQNYNYFDNFNVSAVPEPSTWAMMLIGFSGLAIAGYRRTRRRRATFAA
jgi:hypothetical protein